MSRHQWKPLLFVAFIFLFVGSIICMNDILLPSLKTFFHLSYTKATFIQQSFYLVYLLFPIPIAFYISKYGYKIALLTALIVCSVGCIIFIPAYFLSSYAIVLIALFIVSLGITLINVAANPLAIMLGTPDGAHARINFVQVFSRIGYSLTPVVGTQLIYGSDKSITFYKPYLFLGIGIFLLAILIYNAVLPAIKPAIEKRFTLFSILKESKQYPQLYWGAVIMFFYVGAEACTAGFFINYLQTVAGFNAKNAAHYLTYYYVIATVIGFTSIYFFKFISAGKLVALFGLGMITLYFFIAFTHSSYNPYLLVMLGIFISIIFPTLFSLGIEHIGNFTEKGSALINIAIVGGAVFPPIQGMIADSKGVQISYIIPMLCFVLIVIYGWYCHRRSIN
ncbi:MAG: MFS transporter [Chitinophagaceae bacterium]|jgi:FHS family L-fucose permease-like MFS transporter|nr:MFS transporter [Chitinophagaceae bacterium]